MAWPRDDAKLGRVRALMADRDLDALVVRAPDNVLYLTNFWGMKGFDACVFPREGEPVLIALEPSADDIARTAWTQDVRFFGGYDAADPRPPGLRALDLAREAAAAYGKVAGLRPRRGHRRGRGGGAGAAVLARLVGSEHQALLGDDRRPDRRGRADAVRDLGMRRRLLGRPHEEPLPRDADPALRRAARPTQRRLRRRGLVLRARREPLRARPARPRGHR